MTDKVENIIDNINICEEIEDAVEAFTEAIKEHSIPRRAAFFGCIHILMRYGDQKKWTAQQLKDGIGKYIDLHMGKEG